MQLQLNYSGAWKNVALPPPLHLTTDEEQLKAEAVARRGFAKGLRIKDDGGAVIWMWNAESGWYRPHWYVPHP